jgi:hypothetical protein
MAIQVITIMIDTEKVTEYGTLILKVVPPREDLPHGTILLHDPLSLPGFKMKVTLEAPTISINLQFMKDVKMPPKPITSDHSSPAISAPAAPKFGASVAPDAPEGGTGESPDALVNESTRVTQKSVLNFFKKGDKVGKK